jgi:hypothetical protein
MTNIIKHPDNTSQAVLIGRIDLATRWQCSVMTIKRREKDGLLKPVYLSNRIVRYRLQDIKAIEAAQ